MRIVRVAGVAGAAVLFAATAVVSPVRATPGPVEFDEEFECIEAVPDAASVSTTPGLAVTVDVLYDGVNGADQAAAQAVIERAAVAYSPLGISLSGAHFQAVTTSSDDVDAIMATAKAATGGAPRFGADVVYLLTGRDMEADGNTAIAGLADCIGGVRFDHRAFAVGENAASSPPLEIHSAAKIAAHEIGHLFGGHHHYANCAEALLPSEDLAPCTLMFNVANFVELRFSAVNGSVVRGHAEAVGG